MAQSNSLVSHRRPLRVASADARRTMKVNPTSISKKNVLLSDCSARILGYNELARLSTTLGERVYNILNREAAIEDFRALGGTLEVQRGVNVFTLPLGPTHVTFSEKDIELMRLAVAEYDAKHPPQGK